MNNFSQRVSFYLSTFKYKNVNAKNKTKENKTKRKKKCKMARIGDTKRYV